MFFWKNYSKDELANTSQGAPTAVDLKLLKHLPPAEG
jgi:hypothetical protein